MRAYVGELVGVIGHADRAGPMRDYCTGLLLPGERKSIEPMAALKAPAGKAAQFSRYCISSVSRGRMRRC